MSTIKVQNIQHTGSSTNAIALASDGTCTANLSNRQNRNLIINGAMEVAQRGTTSTSNGYQTVDRFYINFANTDEAPTQAQADVASGTTPYTLGFRKSFKITNGNQTSGAGAADRMRLLYIVEAQDLAKSGWNYTDANSKITLSFWIKSSVSQNFYFRVATSDGTSYNFPMETGVLTADTWTKVTKTISGNSNLAFNNDNGIGLYLSWAQYRGTDNTDSGVALNTWTASGSGYTLFPDYTSTWYTTNDATWELTGVQLEVGSVATDFEHRSFEEEEHRCFRYYQNFDNSIVYAGFSDGNTSSRLSLNFQYMRATRDIPSISYNNQTTGSAIAARYTKKMAGIVVNTTNSRGGTGYITDILIDSEL